MTSKEKVLKRERERGRISALEIQEKSFGMTGTELNTVEDRIPCFKKAVEKMNMLDRNIGFVCKSSAGRIVRLLQNYDSTIYMEEPEDLPAQWDSYGLAIQNTQNHSFR